MGYSVVKSRFKIILDWSCMEKNGSRYQIAAVTSIFFAKTPFFLFRSGFFPFALFLFPLVLLSSQPLPLPDQACDVFKKFKFICLCHVYRVLTLCFTVGKGP